MHGPTLGTPPALGGLHDQERKPGGTKHTSGYTPHRPRLLSPTSVRAHNDQVTAASTKNALMLHTFTVFRQPDQGIGYILIEEYGPGNHQVSCQTVLAPAICHTPYISRFIPLGAWEARELPYY